VIFDRGSAYAVYNGLGTWRGSQSAINSFEGDNGAVLKNNGSIPNRSSPVHLWNAKISKKEGELGNIGSSPAQAVDERAAASEASKTGGHDRTATDIRRYRRA
jgi:hypothetical protein